MKLFGFTLTFVLFLATIMAQEGPYAPAAGSDGTTAIHADSNVFVNWATYCELDRGWLDIADTTLGFTSVGDAESCIGVAGDNGVVSLGDGGKVILTFNGIIYDDDGPDFAIFENSFSDYFLELGIVEVSSDGENYFPFPSVSLTQTDSQVVSFGLLDPTNIYNLAGKYRGLYGSPFDLAELSDIDNLDINAITHVRITDVVGSIDDEYASYDSEGYIINDPYPTAFESGGFDLDAVGVIHWSTTASIEESTRASLRPFPNPFNNRINIKTIQPFQDVKIYDSMGRIQWRGKSGREASLFINSGDWKEGLYIIHILNSQSYPVIKI